MKQWMTKATAIALSGLMALSCLTGCGSRPAEPTKTAAHDKETEQVTDAAISLLSTHSDTAGKNETVYVIADALGNPQQTIVSTWLKNPDGADELRDHAELKDIKNVKGDETFSVSNNGDITWQAKGSDIHYQGTTDQQLPVTVSVTYELDGKEITADELSGKTGHLKVTFRYTNHAAVERTVEGKTVTLYQPFLVVSGLALDDNNAANVTVTHGKVIQTGDRSLVVGMALPGLRESLGLDSMHRRDGGKLDLDIPESVVVEADVRDFKLLTTVTMVENSPLQDLDLSHVNSVDDLRGAMEQLSDGSARLVEGSGALYDGVSALNTGAGQLSDGIGKLDDGAKQLSDGAKQLSDGAKQTSDGAKQLSDGAFQLSDGSAALRDGAKAVDDGTKQLSDGAASAAQGSAALSTGASRLADGAGELSENMDTLSTGLDTLSDGAERISSGLTTLRDSLSGLPSGVETLYNGLLRLRAALKGDQGKSVYEGAIALQSGADAISRGLVSHDANQPGLYEGALALADGAGSIKDGANNIATAAAQVKAGIDRIPGAISAATASASGGLNAASAQLTAILDDENLTDEQRAAIQTALGYIGGVNDGLSSVSVDLTQADAALDAIANGADAISGGAAELQTGANRLAGGASALRDGADQLSGGANTLAAGVEQIAGDENLGAMINGVASLSGSASSLTDAVDQLTTGAQTLSGGVSDAAAGAQQLAQGGHSLTVAGIQLSDGASTLADGISALADGASALKDGTGRLYDGAKDAADGASALADGAKALASGTVQVSGGANALADGASDLKDGTAQLKSGSDALCDGVAQILEGAGELRDGMTRFDREGIRQLTDLVEGDAVELIARLRALQELSGEYTSFAGTDANVPGTVRFIIRTDSIGE